MALKIHAIEAGDPYPLGATWDGSGVNFALFSAHAERVELCLFDASGRKEIARHELPGNTNQVWHGYLPYAGPGTLYGYRVYGPYDPTRGHRFNPNKLLLDPYARQFHGAIRWSDSVNGYRAGNKSEDLSFCKRDSASAMPKCVVTDPAGTWGQDSAPDIPWAETVIYETHVRGMTRLHPKVSKGHRGTYTGLADPHMIDYLKSLGVTTVELLPVQAFVNDRFLVERKLKNYWGYSTLGYFCPHEQYAHGNAIQDFKTMVRRFHDANLEVVLDVVYNHTAEGNHLGPHLSWRGIDNASYYRLNPQERRYYINDTGCGNTLNLTHPRVLQMVMDSLRYWVKEMHVDGFRFDLASTLGREEKGFDGKASFFNAILQDPILNRVKLIAEPWDLGPGGYQLGQFPLGWAEWNDRFRDTTRKYWLGQPGLLPELAKSLHGSGDVFEHHDRQPWASVNFITSHDGFTLRDLVSYENKHNEANGEENRDGHGANYSANFGVEGETEDEAINALRWQRMRNLMASLLFSQGTPMILAGDEIGHTKQGNNNAYCQDNEINWLDWSLNDEQKRMRDFTARLLALRKQFPVLRRDRFVHGEPVKAGSPIKDIDWVGAHGETLHESEWRELTKRSLGVVLSDASGKKISSLLIILNASESPVPFSLPVRDHAAWKRILDSAEWGKDRPEPIEAGGTSVTVPAYSVQVWHCEVAG